MQGGTQQETDAPASPGAPPRSARPPLPSIPSALDTEGFRREWAAWQEHRREIGHPLRKQGAVAALSRLLPFGPERAAEALRESASNGWRGVFPEKSAPKVNGHPGGWVGQAGDVWAAKLGTPNYGQIGRCLKPAVDRYGERAVLRAWSDYLEREPSAFCSPRQFAGNKLREYLPDDDPFTNDPPPPPVDLSGLHFLTMPEPPADEAAHGS